MPSEENMTFILKDIRLKWREIKYSRAEIPTIDRYQIFPKLIIE